MSEERALAKSFGIISSSTFLSRILGLFRDVFSASLFGASLVWDAFLIAFMIPNLLRRLLGEGALTSSFVPVFTEYLEKKSKKEAWQLVSVVFSVLLVVLALIVLLGIWIISLLLNNFSFSIKIALILHLTRIMLPYIFFISLVALSMGILNSFKHFAVPSLSPIILNICWIVALFLICPRFGQELDQRIFGLALGILLGGMVQLLVQIPILVKKGFNRSNIRFNLDLNHPGLRRIGRLMAPAVLGLAVVQINILVDIILGLMLGNGAVSALYYGNRLMQFPLGVFAIAMGTAVLPTMSSHVARNNIPRLKQTLSMALRMVFFITIPAAIGLMVLRFPIIRVLFQRGQFSSLSTNKAATTLLFYSIGLFSYAGVRIIVPCFYSLQDTITPVKIGAIALVSNIVLNLVLMWPLREGGLALATAISSMINFCILFLILRKRVGNLDGKRIISSFSRILLSASLMGLFCWLISRAVLSYPVSLLHQVLNIFILILGGVFMFFAVSFVLRVEELKAVSRWILGRK